MADIENPFESIRNCIVFHCRDWSTDKRDAWLYGIVCGWDNEALKELQEQFHWDDSAVNRLERLHLRYLESIGN